VVDDGDQVAVEQHRDAAAGTASRTRNPGERPGWAGRERESERVGESNADDAGSHGGAGDIPLGPPLVDPGGDGDADGTDGEAAQQRAEDRPDEVVVGVVVGLLPCGAPAATHPDPVGAPGVGEVEGVAGGLGGAAVGMGRLWSVHAVPPQ